jgi:hypothetical protein
LNSSWDFSSISTTFQYIYASTDEEGGGGGAGAEEEGGGGGAGADEGGSAPAEPFDSNENNNADLNQNTNEDTTQSESKKEGNVQPFLPEILKELEEIPPAQPLDSRFKPYDPSEAKISTPLDKLSKPSGEAGGFAGTPPSDPFGDTTIPQGVSPAKPFDSLAKPYDSSESKSTSIPEEYFEETAIPVEEDGAASEPAPPASGATTEGGTTKDDDALAEEDPTKDDDDALAEDQSSNLAPQGFIDIDVSGGLDALNKAAEDALKQTTIPGGGGELLLSQQPPASKTAPAGGSDGTGTTPTGSSGSGGTGTTPTGSSGSGTGGNANLPPPPPGGSQQSKNDSNDNDDDRVKVVERNKVIFRDNNDNTDKELIVIGDRNTCPTQTETVSLNGKIDPKGIRLLAHFDPCLISDGSVTLNMPNSDNIKLALLFIDKAGNNDVGTTVEPIKIQDISTNQALFIIELDSNMNGIQPMTGQSNTITRINGLALYNDGNEPIQFNSGNMAALTATFIK